MVLAPLQFSGRSLAPDLLGGIQQGQVVLQGENILQKQQLGIQQTQQQQAQEQQQAQQLAQQQELSRSLLERSRTGAPLETNSDFAQLLLENPTLADETRRAAGISTEFQKNELGEFGLRLNALADDPAAQQQLIQQRAQKLESQGRDARDTLALIGADPKGIGQFASLAMLQAFNNDELKEIVAGGKPTQIPAEQQAFEALLEGLSDVDKDKARRIKLRLDAGAVGSAAQTIAEGGTAELIGDSQAIIREREKFGALTGASRSKAIDSGFEKITSISKNITNLDRAIAAVEAGAGTGAIERRFPSIRAASVELDQIQGELALDVIGSVTFGALSEGELNLAKQIALPTGLEGPQLIQHLRDRQAAQVKLLDYFQEQIDFLDQGGSLAGFMRQKSRQAAPQPGQQPASAPEQQAVVRFDRTGKRIQ